MEVTEGIPFFLFFLYFALCLERQLAWHTIICTKEKEEANIGRVLHGTSNAT